MSFKKKIDMILEAKKLERLTKNKIEKLLGVDGTIYKAYDDDREPADSEIVRNLIGKLGIRQAWWDKEWETGSKDIFNTSVQNQAAITEKAKTGDPEVYRTIVEGNTEYVLVPREVMKDSKLIAIDQFTETIEMMKSDRRIMEILVNKFVDAAERLMRPSEPMQPQKGKHHS